LQLPRLERLVAIEASNKNAADALLRLAALLPDEPKIGHALSDALKLSNADRERLVEALESDWRIAARLVPSEARKLLYRMGKRCFRDQLLLRWAEANAKPEEPRWVALSRLVNSWAKPEFPLNGRDAMAAGIDEGPKVGVVLRTLEQEWVEADFQGDRRALLKRLRETVKKPRK